MSTRLEAWIWAPKSAFRSVLRLFLLIAATGVLAIFIIELVGHVIATMALWSLIIFLPIVGWVLWWIIRPEDGA